MTKPLKVLLLCDNDRTINQGAIHDHISAFTDYSRHLVVPFNPRRVVHGNGLSFDAFDVIIVHFSLWILWDDYLPPPVRERIRHFKGLKVQFLQDEYRLVDRTVDAMKDLGIHVLFTVIPPDTSAKVYHHQALDDVTIHHTLTGFAPPVANDVEIAPVAGRPVHVGYRGRECEFWLGDLAREKVLISDGVTTHAETYGLRCDISWRFEDRIYGASWLDFIMSCRAFLGTESGASIVDFDGTLEEHTKAYLGQHPDASYKTVSGEILAPYEGNIVIHTCSPRVFECAAMKTAMVNFPGDYGGVIRPWDHYIPLEKDFSNMSEVAAKLKDDTFLQDMVDRTYDDLIASGRYTFQRFVEEFDDSIERDFKERIEGRAESIFSFLPMPPRRIWSAGQSLRFRAFLRLETVVLGCHRFLTRSARFLELTVLALYDRPTRKLLAQALPQTFSRGSVNFLTLIAEAARASLLCRRCVIGVDGSTVLSVVTEYDEGASALILRGSLKDAGLSLSQDVLTTPEIASLLAQGSIKEIRWLADLEPHQLPRLIEEKEYGFPTLLALAPQCNSELVHLLVGRQQETQGKEI